MFKIVRLNLFFAVFKYLLFYLRQAILKIKTIMSKTKNNYYAAWLIIVLAVFSAADSYGQNTHVMISGIRSEKGQIILNVFKDDESYNKEKVFKKMVFEKKAITSGLMVIACDLAPGTYGITLIDDENKDAELNKSFIGIPKEGFGFSNFFMEKMKKPAFDDFKIVVKSQDNKISIKVKYM